MTEEKKKALFDLVDRLDKICVDAMQKMMQECLQADKEQLTAEDAITATRFVVEKLHTTFEQSWKDFSKIKGIIGLGKDSPKGSPYNQT